MYEVRWMQEIVTDLKCTKELVLEKTHQFLRRNLPQAPFRAMKEFQGTFCEVICERFYTSVMVFLQLLKIGLFAIGTTMPNRKGFPVHCTIGKDRHRLLSRGYLIMCTSKSSQTRGYFLGHGMDGLKTRPPFFN